MLLDFRNELPGNEERGSEWLGTQVVFGVLVRFCALIWVLMYFCVFSCKNG